MGLPCVPAPAHQTYQRRAVAIAERDLAHVSVHRAQALRTPAGAAASMGAVGGICARLRGTVEGAHKEESCQVALCLRRTPQPSMAAAQAQTSCVTGHQLARAAALVERPHHGPASQGNRAP
jgi:hypothetical protein